MAHEFLRTWARFRPVVGPNILTGDELLLDPAIAKRFTIHHPSWKHFLKDPHFNSFDPKGLHLSLIPKPFIGNIDSAPVVILTLNPGWKPIDYFAEHCVKQYRRALVANLRLGFKKSRFPNVFLNPEFSWHSGFTYWHGRLAEVIAKFATDAAMPRIDALSFVSKSIAMLELVPYHSASFGLTDRVMSGLHSVQLARSFLTEVILPRTKASQVLLVVVRQAKRWELSEGRGVVVYEGGETRAAYLTPNSRGGKAILAHLRRVWKEERA